MLKPENFINYTAFNLVSQGDDCEEPYKKYPLLSMVVADDAANSVYEEAIKKIEAQPICAPQFGYPKK